MRSGIRNRKEQDEQKQGKIKYGGKRVTTRNKEGRKKNMKRRRRNVVKQYFKKGV